MEAYVDPYADPSSINKGQASLLAASAGAEPIEPLTFSGVLHRAGTIIRSHKKSTLFFALFVFAPLAAISVIVSSHSHDYLWIKQEDEKVVNGTTVEKSAVEFQVPDIPVWVTVLSVIEGVVALVASAVGAALATYLAACWYLGQRTYRSEASHVITRVFWRLIGTMVAYVLGIILASSLGIIVLVLTAMLLHGSGLLWLAFTLLFVEGFIILIYLLYLGVGWSLANEVAAVEAPSTPDMWGFKALCRSFHLIRGSWFAALGLAILQIVIGLIFNSVGQALYRGTKGSEPGAIVSIVFLAVLCILIGIVQVFFFIADAVLYFSCRKKNGTLDHRLLLNYLDGRERVDFVELSPPGAELDPEAARKPPPAYIGV